LKQTNYTLKNIENRLDLISFFFRWLCKIRQDPVPSERKNEPTFPCTWKNQACSKHNWKSLAKFQAEIWLTITPHLYSFYVWKRHFEMALAVYLGCKRWL